MKEFAMVTDIFISYSRKDGEAARLLSIALKNQGWSVWWDNDLRGGDPFNPAIKNAVIAARCVVVLWSQFSVKSAYVASEVSVGYDHGKLVPAKIDSIGEVDIPPPYNELHVNKLVGWSGSEESADFTKLVEDISHKIGSPPGILLQEIAAALHKRPGELQSRDYPNLNELVIRDRPLIDISLLENLVNLEILVLKGTRVNDLRPLRKLTRLERLGLRDTRVQELEPLSALTELQELILVNTPVNDLGPLKNLPRLKHLDLRESKVTSLEPLSGVTSLRRLYLGRTSVSDLKPLRGLSGLRMLGLRLTKVTDLTPLRDLVELEKLFLKGTAVMDLTPLLGLTALQSLDLTDTQIPQQEIDKLRTALPNLVIDLQSGEAPEEA